MSMQTYEATEVLAHQDPISSPFISTDIVTEESALMALEAEWEGLTLKSSATIFQTFDWQFSWWQHFGRKPRHHLLIVAIKLDGRLIGLAPFFLQTHTMLGFRIFRQLKLMGSGLMSERSPIVSLEKEGPADYLDIIADRDHEEEVATSIVDFLKENEYLWDEIELQNLPEDGVLMKHILPKMQTSDFTVSDSPTDVCPRIILPPSMSQYLSSLKSNIKRSLRRSFRTFIESPDYTIEHARGNFEGALQILSALHQSRWNSVGYPGLFSDRRFAEMQRQLVKVMSPKNRVWMTVIRHDGKPIAARLCFTYNGRVFDYLSGVESGGARRGTQSHSGAGMASLYVALEQSIESGYTIFDLLRGDEAYKFDLTPVIPTNHRLSIKSKTGSGKRTYPMYSIHSAKYSGIIRFSCESAIFKSLAAEHGIPAALLRYPLHLLKRITKYNRKLSSATGESSSHNETVSNEAPTNA